MKHSILLLVMVSILSGQSFFNMHALGELISCSDARSVALASPLALSSSNPGMLVTLPQSRLSFTAVSSVVLASSASLSRTLSSVRPAGIWGATPLPYGLRLALSVSERFNQDFDVWTESSAISPYWYHIVGRGGIYTLGASLTASFLNHLGVGLGYSRILGGSREDWNFITGDNRYRSTDTIELDWTGSALSGGISFQHQLFTAGAVFELAHKLRINRFKHVHGTISDTEQLFTIHLPSTFGTGIGIRLHPKVNFRLGSEIRPWARALFNDSAWSRLRDIWHLSVGLEFEPTEGLPLRFGYAHGDWYCWNQSPAPSERTPIVEHSLHVGTGFPIRRFGSIDFAVAAALRKSQTPSGVLHENAFKLNITFAYSEAWMRRTRRWGY